jgi:glycosyltransferase involved in cell wall biosynthesis
LIFLIQSPHGWRSGAWQRPHHLATRFARAGHFVRYVQPRYVKWLAREPGRFARTRSERSGNGDRGVEVKTVTLLNGERFAAIRRFNQLRLTRALRAPAPPAASGPRVLWLYNPHEAHLAETVPHDLLVYDIMDEYRGFPWSPPGVEREEAELLRRADWVFAGTRALYDAKRPTAEGRIECVLSGVEVERFARPSQGGTQPPPSDLAPLKETYARLLGYAGTIDLRVDRELLAASARRHRDWGFVLLGPTAGEVGALRAEPNVHLLGAKRYEELPGYYHAFDVALLPFIENELTRHINPTKMLEYAAAGLPIVARALPDVERFYGDGAWLYRTGEEFERALQSALSPEIGQERANRLSAARGWMKERDWNSIAASMLDRLALPKNPPIQAV